MMGDGSLCLYKPGDQISVTQLDGTNKVYDVLAVVDVYTRQPMESQQDIPGTIPPIIRIQGGS